METTYTSAYSVINYNPTTKEQAALFSEKLTEEVLQGEVNPLELHIKLVAMEKAFEKVKANIKSLVIEEAEKHGQKSFEHLNSRIEIQELGVKYDFSNCNDSAINDLYEKQEKLKEEIKARETLLKACKPGQILVNEETGETHEVNPPVKTSTTGIKVTLK